MRKSQPEAPASALSRLQALQQCQAANAALFPSLDSLRWYVRRNRVQLIDRGALVLVAGRLFVDPAPFADAVVDIGRSYAGKVIE